MILKGRNPAWGRVRFRRYLDDLYMCELSDGVVWQVDVPPSVKLAHASSVQHGLGAVQTTAARGGSVDCRGDFNTSTNTLTRTDKSWCCQPIIVKSLVSSGTLPHFTLLTQAKGLAVVTENVHSSQSLHSMNAAFKGLAVKWLGRVSRILSWSEEFKCHEGRFLESLISPAQVSTLKVHIHKQTHTHTVDSSRFFVFLLISCD